MKTSQTLFTGGAMLALWAAAACAQSSVSTPAVQVIVTAEARHGKDVPAVTQSDVSVTSGKDRLTVLDWVPAQADRAGLQLLLLMDDSSNTDLGTQLSDLKSFITKLPAGTEIAVGYMRNGTVLYAQEFTKDHAAAAQKLRLPLGSPGANASPYFSLVELFKNWAPINGRREILMISDGIDRYGETGPDNPYVLRALERAQRAGVSVSSIYWNGVGHYGHSFYRLNWGQNYLAQLADGTGGEAYWQGFGNPVSFGPYLDDFAGRLGHQYLLTYRPKPQGKAGLQPLKVRTELQDVELVAPAAAWVPMQ